MILAQVNFGNPLSQVDDFDAIEMVAEGYLYALQANGQICSEILCAKHNGEVIGYVNLAKADSFEHRYHFAGKARLGKTHCSISQEPDLDDH